MVKVMAGVLCGALAGGVAMSFINTGSGSGDAPSVPATAATADENAGETANLKARIADLEGKLQAANSLVEQETRNRRAAETERRALEPVPEVAEVIAKAEEENAKHLKTIGELLARVQALETQGQSAEAAALAEDEKRIAEVRAQARGHAASVSAAIASGDKKAVVEGLAAIRALGADAAGEYFKAFNELIEKNGTSFFGPNPLGLTFQESSVLMPKTFRDIALADSSGGTPDAVRSYAAYSLPWDGEMTAGQKQAVLGQVYDTAASADLKRAALDNMRQVNDPAALPFYSKAAVDPMLPADVRATAIGGMARLDDQADWPLIESFRNDPDPVVSGAARMALVRKSPPATGVLVTSFEADTNAARSGLQVGDIIVSYNGQPTPNLNALGRVRQQTSADLPVIVMEVVRNGARTSMTVGPGQLGIQAENVTAK